MRIVFFGTPAFAATSLYLIVEKGWEVVGVVTAPDRPAGRGMKPKPSAVKEAAVQLKLPVLQPLKLKDPEFLSALKEWDADLQIVIAFRMLPLEVWNMPPMGTFNLHASLLPKYRGAAPIQRAIMNHEKLTGLTTFFLKHEIDTGDILLQTEVIIDEEMTGGELHDVLMVKGAELVHQTLEGIHSNSLHPIPQPIIENTPVAPKIFTEDCRILWNRKGRQIVDLVRALNPMPAAFFEHEGQIFKVFKVEFIEEESNNGIGDYSISFAKGWRWRCADGWINLLEIQQQGKKRMPIRDYLNGMRIQ